MPVIRWCPFETGSLIFPCPSVFFLKMEFLLEILFEFFGGLIMEGLAELISRFFRASVEPRPQTSSVHVPRAILCQLAGVAGGLISLLFASHHIITSPQIRFLN